jgi:hypothetical protein
MVQCSCVPALYPSRANVEPPGPENSGSVAAQFRYAVCGHAACCMHMRAFCSIYIATEVFGYAAICGTGLQRLSRAISEAIFEAEPHPVTLPAGCEVGPRTQPKRYDICFMYRMRIF